MLQTQNRTTEESSSEVPYRALACANQCDSMGMIMAEYNLSKIPFLLDHLKLAECVLVI